MTALEFESATGYDLFISLFALHDPGRFGLRGAWAAGIRARTPEAERTLLEELIPYFLATAWVYKLPPPRDAAGILTALSALPAGVRLESLFCAGAEVPCELFRRIASHGEWDEADLAEAARLFDLKAAKSRRPLAAFLDRWSRPAESGELLLSALRAYVDAFFAEEEKRIQPWLEHRLAQAQELAAELPLPALLERLSDGARLETPMPDRLTVAPSFWSAPLIVPNYVAPDHLLYLFGARPSHVSLVPGTPVPDDLTRALKALADPTRLRILRYLQQEPQNPTALARRLRLRAPTVIHHLDALRLARFVQVTVGEEGRRVYALRPGAISKLTASLEAFLGAAAEDPHTEFLQTNVDIFKIDL